MEKPRVLIVTTMDTNVQEATFLKECLVAEEVRVLILDAGIKSKSPIPVEISRDEIAIAASSTIDDVQDMGYEGKALSIMISGAIRTANELYDAGKIDGIIGIGGSMETTLGTAVMRTFPIGFPKLMISFVASSNTRSLVGTKDIMMLYSSYDFADLNGMAKHILREGALAMAGMTKEKRAIPTEGRPIAVLSTLGMTESCAVYLRQRLESMRMEVITFDTVGSGGEAMDEFIRDEDVRLVIDFSLHEIVDHLFGGDYDAGPMRSMAALQKGTPTILIPGNTDFILTVIQCLLSNHLVGRSSTLCINFKTYLLLFSISQVHLPFPLFQSLRLAK